MSNKQNWLFNDNNFFEILFNNTIENTIVVMDEKGVIIDINKAFTNCFGYQPHDLTGKYFGVLFTAEDQQAGLPEREIQSVLKTGQGSDNNYLVSQNNTITWVSGESVLFENTDGRKVILKIIQNIHKLKESELSLKNLNTFNTDILTAIKDVVVVLNEKMEIVLHNGAFTEIFIGEHKAMPIDFIDFLQPYDLSGELQNNLSLAIKNKKGFYNIPLELKTVGGEKRVFEFSSSLVYKEGNGINILLVIHDITIFKQLERAREDLIGFVAHELRNPLANLVLCNDLMGEMLKEKKLEDAAALLQRSKNNVQRLNKLIAELYNATKMNSETLSLEISIFTFSGMVAEAIETIASLQPDYNIIVKGNGDIKIRGDKYRLIEVVVNYLSNGIKYSNGNKDVVLTMSFDQHAVTVAVQDNGLGISQEELPYVFERYFRAEQSRSLEGLGLGLYLCRRIINAHKGNVWVESNEGKGSVFYFSVPL